MKNHNVLSNLKLGTGSKQDPSNTGANGSVQVPTPTTSLMARCTGLGFPSSLGRDILPAFCYLSRSETLLLL
jgi:hypothetical protein